RGPQFVVGLLVRALLGREPAAVHAVVDRGVDPRVQLVDLVAVRLRIEVRGAVAVEVGPLGEQVEVELLVRVGHHGGGGQIHQRGDGDATRIVGDAVEIRGLQTVQAGDRVLLVRIEVEDPRVDVVGRAGQAHGD